MSNTNHSYGTIANTSDDRTTQPDSDARQTRKPSRFGWLLDESVFQGFLLVAVLVALIDGLSSVNHIGIV
ncbi:MAG TPA: hypothetical protein VFV10_18675 [Gammaproteobacteria bacterium]|nr:hypothetical protein [Gammaproteobacteria bacterium]